MELKRWVLLENNEIIDTTKAKYGMINDGLYKENALSFFPMFVGKPIATSNDVFELVKEGDLIVVSDSFGNENTFEVESVNLEEEVIYYYDTYSHTFMFPIEFENVVRINKKQGKNYICVWERE